MKHFDVWRWVWFAIFFVLLLPLGWVSIQIQAWALRVFAGM